MKFYLNIASVIFLTSCGPFDQERVLTHKSDLMEIIRIVPTEKESTITSDADNNLGLKMRSLGIDIIYYNNTRSANPDLFGFVEESDSLIVFIKKRSNLFVPEKRIIYDLSDEPRRFGNDNIEGAAYKIIQLSERWYFSTVGFD